MTNNKALYPALITPGAKRYPTLKRNCVGMAL